MSARALVVGSAAAALALAGTYAAVGGGRYTPREPADPCERRSVAAPEGTEELAQRLALAGLDGAACDLDISREELVLALVREEDRKRLGEERGIGGREIAAAIQAGIVRAVGETEGAGAGEIAAAVRLLLESVIGQLLIQ